jgi:hypothetical protein
MDPSLTGMQFHAAWKWLKQMFREKWLHNDKLREQLVAKKTGSMSRQQKKAVNASFNDAYQAWFNLLTGNSHFGYAILHHGSSSPTELNNLIAAYQKYIDSSKHSKQLEEAAAAKGDRARLRREASAASQEFKRGQYLQQQIDAGTIDTEQLSHAERMLVQRFRQGDLDRRKRVADVAYNNGGRALATCLSTEEICAHHLR